MFVCCVVCVCARIIRSLIELFVVFVCLVFFFFKQKTAYEMRISDWSSDVCSSDLIGDGGNEAPAARTQPERPAPPAAGAPVVKRQRAVRSPLPGVDRKSVV